MTLLVLTLATKIVTTCVLSISFLFLGLLFLRAILIRTRFKPRWYADFCCWIGWHWKTQPTNAKHGIYPYCTHCKQTGLIDGNGDFFIHSSSIKIND